MDRCYVLHRNLKQGVSVASILAEKQTVRATELHNRSIEIDLTMGKELWFYGSKAAILRNMKHFRDVQLVLSQKSWGKPISEIDQYDPKDALEEALADKIANWQGSPQDEIIIERPPNEYGTGRVWLEYGHPDKNQRTAIQTAMLTITGFGGGAVAGGLTSGVAALAAESAPAHTTGAYQSAAKEIYGRGLQRVADGTKPMGESDWIVKASNSRPLGSGLNVAHFDYDAAAKASLLTVALLGSALETLIANRGAGVPDSHIVQESQEEDEMAKIERKTREENARKFHSRQARIQKANRPLYKRVFDMLP